MRRLGGAAAAAGVLLLLTGCGSQATAPTATPTVTVVETRSATPSASPAPTSATTTTTSSSPAPSSGGTAADSGRPADQCADGDLGVTISAADGGGAAGSEYFNVLFTNTGGSSCQLRGTPGVSVVGKGNGTQLGEPADRRQTDVTTLRLAVGQTVAAPLRIVNIRDGGGPIGSDCAVTKGDGYRVYPPHSKKAFFVESTSAYACTSTSTFMTVDPLIRFTD